LKQSDKDKWEWITFIQWKGTDVCMDWVCVECGNQEHEDRDFCYEVQCRKCKTIYKVGSEVKLTKIKQGQSSQFEAVLAQSKET
jgi:hypothetical protein